jgi:hypothetical protein
VRAHARAAAARVRVRRQPAAAALEHASGLAFGCCMGRTFTGRFTGRVMVMTPMYWRDSYVHAVETEGKEESERERERERRA